MKADDRILSAARKAKGCPFQGSSRVPQPWQDLKASRALKTRLFGDRGFESVFLQRRVRCEPEFGGGHPIDDPGMRRGGLRCWTCPPFDLPTRRGSSLGSVCRAGTNPRMKRCPLELGAAKSRIPGVSKLTNRRALEREHYPASLRDVRLENVKRRPSFRPALPLSGAVTPMRVQPVRSEED